jgi:hypothetical protein
VDEAIAFAPASRPIDMYFNSIDPPLSREEINAVTSKYHSLYMLENAVSVDFTKYITEK